MRARSTLLIAAVLLLAGCSSDNHTTKPDSTEDLVWMGTVAGASAGDVAVSLHLAGKAVTGSVVLEGPIYHGLTGTCPGDSLLLVVNGGGVLHARVGGTASDTLSGWLNLGGGVGTFVLRRVPLSPLTTIATVDLPFSNFNLAWDGALMWSASDESHIRTTLAGTVVDSVEVHVRDALWVATVSGWDGDRMWGAYPLSIVGPGTIVNAAELLGYDANGRTGDSVYVAHRPHGLAHDGTAMWSLRSDPPALLRLDGSGATAESLHVNLPDATKLAWDGTHFWVLSWFPQNLCRLDAGGNVDVIFPLPGRTVPGRGPDDTGLILSGLVYDGSAFVISESRLGQSRLNRVVPSAAMVAWSRGRVAR